MSDAISRARRPSASRARSAVRTASTLSCAASASAYQPTWSHDGSCASPKTSTSAGAIANHAFAGAITARSTSSRSRIAATRSEAT